MHMDVAVATQIVNSSTKVPFLPLESRAAFVRLGRNFQVQKTDSGYSSAPFLLLFNNNDNDNNNNKSRCRLPFCNNESNLLLKRNIL